MHTYIYIHPLTNVLPSTPYGIQEIAQTRFYMSRSLWRGQRSNQGHTMTLHTYNPQPMLMSSINFLHLTASEISPGQDFIGQGHYGKVKSRSHHDEVHLHPVLILEILKCGGSFPPMSEKCGALVNKNGNFYLCHRD